eukprot:CAMPEP_0113935114 /NCGR_PEP_ID=MMETSP1339-20121228/2337_1 /TAXON_ID=94617 /ORGANISM="Fibrocapsa japonica" /LENGTH=342 /DNA_ID=CAMNT_0000937157 /DNA_START=158 /DNA_END=1186 /DNA_ORIENTATION=+ /assembly_acc=CAM_ASM_000762
MQQADDSPVHLTLKTGDNRVIVIGDVHGSYDELVSLLDACGRKDSDIIVFVGDLVNKGPKPVECVRFARSTPNAYCVMGNHDLKAIKAFRSWKNGGKLKKKYKYVEDLTQEDYDWLYNLPYTISLPDRNALVVHAGLVPGVSLEDQNLVEMVTMRNLLRSDDNSWEALERPTEGVAWASAWEGPEHVYFGHDAKRGLQQWRFATGLDTGCCKGLHLTACILPGAEIVSVAAMTPAEDRATSPSSSTGGALTSPEPTVPGTPFTSPPDPVKRGQKAEVPEDLKIKPEDNWGGANSAKGDATDTKNPPEITQANSVPMDKQPETVKGQVQDDSNCSECVKCTVM